MIYLGKSGSTSPTPLPSDAVTRTFGIFGVKDSGKSTTARAIVEGVCRLKDHAVILDPVGVWWGITRAGEGPGVPGIVIGGEHGDVPLEETGGQLVAELCVARHWPVVVVDLKLLRKGQAQRFMADFLEGIYHANRRPLMLVMEEADRALPQNPRGMDPTLGRVLGAAEDIVKLGRSRGLGSMFISQRMATVTKNVVEQVECLILHAQPGPRDRKAVKEWVEANGDTKATQKVMNSMATLPQGEAWLYSPVWMKVLERIRVKKGKTLDSSSTPTDDERDREEAAPRAKVDLDELKRMMAETVERQAANDPKALRAQLADAEAEVEELRRQLEERPPETVRVLVPDRDAVARLLEATANLDAAEDDAHTIVGEMEQLARAAGAKITEALHAVADHVEALKGVADAAARLPSEGRPAEDGPPRRSLTREPGTEVVTPRASAPARRSAGVTGGEQKVLDALAWWEAVGVTAPERSQIAFVAGWHVRTKSYLNALSSLHTADRIEYGSGTVSLTAAGRRLANGPSARPTRRELHEMIFEQIGPARTRILKAILAEHPRPIARTQLAAQLGWHERTKSFLNGLSKLSSLGLAHYPEKGYVAATDLLFPSFR